MKGLFAFLFLLISVAALAQDPVRGLSDRFRGLRNVGTGSDTLARRNKWEDSITISYRYLDTLKSYKLDSSIRDYSVKYPIPADYYYLGNTGSAAQPFLFAPSMKAGWDAGFHAFDVYKYTVEKARFFTSTRPYSEISYLLGTRSEQTI